MIRLFLIALSVGGVLVNFSAAITCEQYKNDFSKVLGSSVQCFSSHLSPMSLCGSCRRSLTELHKYLDNRTVISPSGVPCVDLIISSDKYSIDLVSYVTVMWNRSFCSQCLGESVPFTTHLKLKENPVVHWSTPALLPLTTDRHSLNDVYNLQEYNNITVQFFTRLNDTLSCFSLFVGNTNTSILDILSFPNPEQLAIDRSVCLNCSQSYFELLQFYKDNLLRLNSELGREMHQPELGRVANNRFAVCSDVQNALNRTQWAWDELLDCHPVERSNLGACIPLLLCVVTLILFHVLSYSVCRHPVQMLIYHPKRVELRLPSGVSTTHINASTVIRDQLSAVPSYGSIASSSLQNPTSCETPLHCQRFARQNSERSHL